MVKQVTIHGADCEIELRRDLAGTAVALQAEREKVEALLAVLHPGVIGLIHNYHCKADSDAALAAIATATKGAQQS
jgi:hypothetical protein